MYKHIIIVLDAGHGGHDSGALGKHSKEKINALNLVLALGKKLEEIGFTVIYTRKTDKYLTLRDRSRIANNKGATIFISAHNNSAVSSATGFETFIYNGNVSNNTRRLQSDVHNAIAKEIGIRDRGKKRANFSVVRRTNMPALLIEYAFISNRSDERILINEVDKLAQLTANGIAKYFGVKILEGLTMSEIKKINERFDKIEAALSNKLDVPSSNQNPTKSHAAKFKQATDYGLTIGTNPREYITKEQNATMLINLIDRFIKNDLDAEEYAKDAMQWAKENGISDISNPAHLATRQQVITMIYLAYKLWLRVDTDRDKPKSLGTEPR